jgi:hypothetical protein
MNVSLSCPKQDALRNRTITVAVSAGPGPIGGPGALQTLHLLFCGRHSMRVRGRLPVRSRNPFRRIARQATFAELPRSA